MNPTDIVDYDTLVAAVTEYLLSQDLTTNDVALWTAMAEDRIGDELRLREQIIHLPGTFVPGAGAFALPDDYAETHTFIYAGGASTITEMSLISPQKITGMESTTGPPCFYSISGSLVLLRPPPDSDYTYTFSYYQRLPSLQAGANWLVQRRPMLYLQAVLLEGYRYFQDETRGDYWEGQYDKSIASLQAADMRARWRPLSRIRSEVPADVVWRRS